MRKTMEINYNLCMQTDYNTNPFPVDQFPTNQPPFDDPLFLSDFTCDFDIDKYMQADYLTNPSAIDQISADEPRFDSISIPNIVSDDVVGAASANYQSTTTSSREEYLQSLPVGYRFLPTDKELVLCYLKRKVAGEPLPHLNKIRTVNLYEFSPSYLADMFGGNEKDLYFFSPLKKISRGGTRIKRTTPGGYWKDTSGDKDITHNGEVIAYKKMLVYYEGKSCKARKTQWIMYEYRLKDPPAPVAAPENNNMDMPIDVSVVCKIHEHNRVGRVDDNTTRDDVDG